MKHIVIPARFSSSRLPGKPLLLIHNRPMIFTCSGSGKKKSKVLMICAWQQMTNVLLRSAVQMELM